MENLLQLREVLTAAANGDDDRLNSLSKEDPSILDLVNEEGASALMYAATNGRESTVRFLLRNHVSIDKMNKYDWTALQQVGGVHLGRCSRRPLLDLTSFVGPRLHHIWTYGIHSVTFMVQWNFSIKDNLNIGNLFMQDTTWPNFIELGIRSDKTSSEIGTPLKKGQASGPR